MLAITPNNGTSERITPFLPLHNEKKFVILKNMKYFGSVLRYLFSVKGAKKCLFYFMFSVIPAGLIAYSMPLYAIPELIAATDPMSFGRLWLSGFRHPFYLIALLAALLAATFVSACYASALSYHMRIGKFGLPRFFTSVNNNFFSCFSRAVIVGASFLAFYTIFVLFDSLWNTILNSLGAVIASSFTFALLLVLFCYAASALSLWLPTMAIAGRPFFAAMTSCISQPRSIHRRFLEFYLLLSLIPLGVAVGAYFVKNFLISWAMTTVSYMFVLVFSHVFWFIAFFEINNMTRADLIVSAYKRRI